MTFVDNVDVQKIKKNDAIVAVYQQEIRSYQQQLWMFGWKKSQHSCAKSQEKLWISF